MNTLKKQNFSTNTCTKNRKTRAISLVLVFAMILCMTPMSVFATEANKIEVIVAGDQYFYTTDDGTFDLSNTTADVGIGSGTVSWDASKKTVTLDNVTWEDISSGGTWFITSATQDQYNYGDKVKVLFKGNNKIKQAGFYSAGVDLEFAAVDETSTLSIDIEYGHAISALDASVKIGKGKYVINNKSADLKSIRLGSAERELRIDDGANIDSTSVDGGLYAKGPLYITGNANVKATSAGNTMWSTTGITIDGGAEVNSKSTGKMAIKTKGDITVSGTETKVTADATSSCLYGKNITISNATVNLHSVDAVAINSGINLNLNSPKLKAKTDKVGESAFNVVERIYVDGKEADKSDFNGESHTTPADYAKVTQAIASIPADLSIYTEGSVNDLNSAKAAVDYTKGYDEQTAVDEMATAIKTAIQNLKYKDADYSEVDAAIDAAGKLDRTLYKDFSAVDAAVKAVVTGKNILEQVAVDRMAEDIDGAIMALVYRDANYTAVNKILKEAKSLEPDLYEDFTKVDAAIKAVITGKNITEQKEVDKMASDIENAIKALVRFTPAEINKTTGKLYVKAKDNKAVLAPEEIMAVKEITVDFGTNKVVYDNKAVEKIKKSVTDATKIEFKLAEVDDTKNMTEAQKKAVEANKSEKIFEISIIIAKEDESVIELEYFEGGKATISVKHKTPAKGMNFEVYRIEKDGTLKLMNSSFKDGILTWITDGHSYYMVKEIAIADTGKPENNIESEEGKNETPKTGDNDAMIPWIILLSVAIAGTEIIVKRRKQN